MTEKEKRFLKKFVLGVCDCSIFTSAQIPARGDLGMVFLPVAFGALSPKMEDLPPRPQPPDPQSIQMGYLPETAWEVYQQQIDEHDRICEAAYKAIWDRVGVIWEYWDQALPRSINGLPCFMSFTVMVPEMWEIARKLIDTEMQRRNDLNIDLDLLEVE